MSVPDGAPDPRARAAASKFAYIDSARSQLLRFQSVILAADSDEPGKALNRKLAHRLSPERCRVVQWRDGIKDGNDALLILGAAELRAAIDGAVQFPYECASSSNSSARHTQWPVLPHEALHGLAGKIVNTFLPETEADPAAILATILAMVGNCGPRAAYLRRRVTARNQHLRWSSRQVVAFAQRHLPPASTAYWRD